MATADPNARARQLADRYWDRLLELDPLVGTSVGDERFDDRLPDPSEAGLVLRAQVQQEALAGLAEIDPAALDAVSRTTLDVLEAIARRELAGVAHRLDRLSIVSHLWGPGQLLAELGSLQRADTPERLEKYVARLSGIPAYLRAIDTVADEAIAAGVTAPGLVVDRAIAQVERLLAVPVASSPGLTPVLSVGGADLERIRALLTDEVMPAYREYLEMLRRYRPHATETIGLSALPGGAEMYDAEILSWTTLPLPAEQVHRLGVEDLAKIQEERRESARRLGFQTPEAAIEAHQASGRNTASSREDMVRRAQEQVEKGWMAAPGFFGRMPAANCEVRAVEEFREKDMPFAFYQGPTADGSRPGVYYVNTSDLAERPLHHLATTTYHEANPGHHFQVSIEQELPDRPALRRFGGILAGSAFIEGWGLYSERLADEMGLFEDEYERLGMLDSQGWRAARLIVDTGIHALGWDRQRSVEQMVEAGVPRVDAEIEVDRYITLPGQALSYKIGQIEIEKWRRAAAQREGAGFSLRAFHDRLLALGSLPLPALQREMGAL